MAGTIEIDFKTRSQNNQSCFGNICPDSRKQVFFSLALIWANSQ
jgi:hypothetical protein